MGDINLKAALGGQIVLTPTNTASNYTATFPAITGVVAVQAAASYTAGSVLFANSSGQIAQNNSQFFWDNTNNRLGIGTASPSYALDVLGQSRVAVSGGSAQLRLERTGTSTGAGWIGADSTSSFAVYDTSFTQLLSLSQSGNLGLGATPSANGSIYYKAFEIGKAGCGLFAATASLTSSELTYFCGNAVLTYSAGPLWSYGNNGNAATYGIEDGVHKWTIAPSGTAGGTITFTQAMTLDASGNLGVGVAPSVWASPFTKAFEIGTVGSIATTTNSLRFANNAYYGSLGWTYKNTAAAAHYDIIDNTHSWYNANSGTAGTAITFTQAMTLDGSGRLGIGLTNQIAKLQVSYGTGSMPSSLTAANSYLYLGGSDYGSTSNAKTAIAFGFTGNTATNAPAYFAYVEGTTSGNTYGDFVFYTRNVTTDTAPSERVRIDSSGNLVVTGSGVLGYGTGSGGTVTQATSKTTAVTLNKTSGKITMNNAALAASTTVQFTVNNTTVTNNDTIIVNLSGGTADGRQYNVWAWPDTNVFYMIVRNISAVSLSEALVINFAVIKGATS